MANTYLVVSKTEDKRSSLRLKGSVKECNYTNCDIKKFTIDICGIKNGIIILVNTFVKNII